MKDWWKVFFKPITSEVMFKPRQGKLTTSEVEQIIKQAKIKGKQKILDLCCGEGRHSIEFAKRGHEVHGLDFSKNFLETAKANALKEKQKINFVTGDMKKASAYFPKQNFDLVLSLYNSFGYFDKRSDDFKTLKEINKSLRVGGYFIINTIHLDGVKARLAKPISIGHETEANLFMIDQAKFNEKTKRTESKWTIIDARKGKTKIFRGTFGQNVYAHSEMKQLLKKSGFKVIKTWGLLHGSPFKLRKSWHQTILAQKIK